MLEFENILKEKFWLESFREWQLNIIKSVIEKNDTLVFMPTWGWKSLTYQFPWVYLKWVSIVISPLISLMKDQVDKLNSLWIRAELINSTITSFEKKMILDELSMDESDSSNWIKFIYIAPERLNDQEFLNVIKNINISLVAIDEAHCISQWWHDFRPSYLKIREFLENLRKEKPFPIIALTATATKKVRKDIIERLWITKFNTFTSWFDRKNLIYIVREISKDSEKLEKVLEIIKKTPPYWIVYCSSVKAVSKVYQYLLENWVSVWIYNWEMKWELREREQNNFMDSSYDVIVATNAFWMWIDKRDIRYVIHYNLPWSIENYYQEAGRAWRDWKTSYSVIIASYQDTIIQEFFIENTYPPREDILKLYNYLYKDFKIWEWVWTQVLKTYNSIAIEADLKSDMKVWSIIKIFEKYSIVKRWFDAKENDTDFRWRWITLMLPKKEEKDIPILWNHQNVLKEESYFKLEQVKKLLFRPGCRKKFILEYFADEEDLKNLSENCWKCDFCLDKTKYEQSEKKEVVPHNVFLIILEFIKRLDDKFWTQILAWILTWSKEKKILDWNLDNDKDFNILWVYNKEIVLAIFDELLSKWFLYKSLWQYPKIWITEKWLSAIYNNSIILWENDSIQAWLFMRVKSLTNSISKSESYWNTKSTKIKIEKIDRVDTYTQTLELLNKWISLSEIAKSREMTLQTIESHIVKLYEFWKISIWEIMKYSELDKLKNIKSIIISNNLEKDKLSPIKELCPPNINYFDIKICLALLLKWDL